MFLNKKLPEGLLQMYKQKQQLQTNEQLIQTQKQEDVEQKIQQEIQVQTEQIDKEMNKEQNLKKTEEQKKNEIDSKHYLKNERKQLMQMSQKKTNENLIINKKRKNPFIKQCDEEVGSLEQIQHNQNAGNRKFFEYIEPQVKQKQLQEGLSNSFIYMAVGPPRSGKTRLIRKLLQEKTYYGGENQEEDSFFQKQIFISPSIIPGVKLCENYNYLKHIDLFLLYNMLDTMDREYQESEEFQKNNVKGHLLLVFDDCIGEMQSLQKKKEFQNIFNNRRQILIALDIEILISSQNAVGIPAFIRKISTGLFLFHVLGGQEYKTIIEENIPKKYSDIFKSVVMEYTKQENECILIQRYPFGIYASANNFAKITLM